MACAAFNFAAVNDDLPRVFTTTLMAGVHIDSSDLSVRPGTVFLRIYIEQDIGEAVRGLVATLNVVGPAIARTVDRSSAFGVIKRQCDAVDRQSIVVREAFADVAHVCAPDEYLSEAARI